MNKLVKAVLCSGLSTVLFSGVGWICTTFPPNFWTIPIVIWLLIIAGIGIFFAVHSLITYLEER